MKKPVPQRFNKHCSNCEFYPYLLTGNYKTWPYYGTPGWTARLFFTTKLIKQFTNEFTLGPDSIDAIELEIMPDQDHEIFIYGPKYLSGYQWQSPKNWVLVSKTGRRNGAN